MNTALAILSVMALTLSAAPAQRLYRTDVSGN